MTTEALESGVPKEDQGPVLGSGWWHLTSVILLGLGVFLGYQIFKTDREVALAIAVSGAVPMTITVIRLILLRRKLGTAQLFVPHDPVPLGFSGSATYVRPMRGGASVRQMEVRLQCEEELEKGSGRNRKTYNAIVYDEPIAVVTTPMMEGLRVQIPFRIPEAGPASLVEVRVEIRWMIRLRLQMNGCPNTRSSFAVQVLPVVVKR